MILDWLGDETIPFVLGLPLVGAVLIVLCGRIPNLRESVTLLTALSLAAVVWSLIPAVMEGREIARSFGQLVPGLGIAFRLEPLGMLFATLAASLWIINSIYSIGYMRGHHEQHQTRFYTFFAISISAALGVACAGNLLTLFICYEILTLSTYPLVSHKGDPKTIASARVYAGLLMATSIGLFLPAVFWTASVAGTLDFRPGGILQGHLDGPLVGLLLGLFVFGIAKAAVIPVHRWLPSAMVAPTPVSALLHAVAVVKAGVFTVTKVVLYIFGTEFLAGQASADWVIWAASFTVLGASAVALRQDNLKRLLAYSTISQLSYIVLAAAVLAPASELGAILHITAHAFGKITLFFAAGAIYVASNKTEISQLDGIGRRMPWTIAAFSIAALSMIGVPPTAGFVSKWFMLKGSLSAGEWVAVTTIVLSTALNAAYFLPIVQRAWFRREKVIPSKEHMEAPWPMVVAMVVTATLTLAFFFLHGPVIELVRPILGVSE